MANAPYDWLQAYEAAQSNAFGDRSADVLQDVIKTAGGDYQKAKDAGIIGMGGGVDWSKAPKPVMSNLPANTIAGTVGGRYGFTDPWSGKPTQSITGNYVNDPNYGMQALVQKRAPDSTEMKLLRAGAISMAMIPMAGVLAPMLSSSLGVSSQMGSMLARLLLSSGSTMAQGGSINPGQIGGSILGGASGIPYGSTIGGMVGGRLTQGS